MRVRHNLPLPAPRGLGLTKTLLILGGLFGSSAACSEPADAPEASSDWPAATILAVDDHPIEADEVDRVASWITLVEPKATPLHLRRLALTNTIFPTRAARVLSGDAWRAARSEAEQMLARLNAGEDVGPHPAFAGSWQELGFESFGAALQSGPGRWSPVFETAGSFHIVQLVDTSEDASVLEIVRIDFPYLSPEEGAELEAAIDRTRLTIVDESWREAVPLSWVYRMQGESS